MCRSRVTAFLLRPFRAQYHFSPSLVSSGLTPWAWICHPFRAFPLNMFGNSVRWGISGIYHWGCSFVLCSQHLVTEAVAYPDCGGCPTALRSAAPGTAIGGLWQRDRPSIAARNAADRGREENYHFRPLDIFVPFSFVRFKKSSTFAFGISAAALAPRGGMCEA